MTAHRDGTRTTFFFTGISSATPQWQSDLAYGSGITYGGRRTTKFEPPNSNREATVIIHGGRRTTKFEPPNLRMTRHRWIGKAENKVAWSGCMTLILV